MTAIPRILPARIALPPALLRRVPSRRAFVRWMHLVMIPLVFWFMIATPDFVRRLFGPRGNEINSDVALLFVTLALIWCVDSFVRGMVGRPGPKLSPRLKTVHRIMHRALIVGLFLVPVGGFLLGLTASRRLMAGGWLPIAPPQHWERANEIVGKIHIYEFYALGVLAAVHAGFHVWRHVRLRDNVLRIMAPRALHRFL